MPVAAFPIIPIPCPTNIWSTILYKLWIIRPNIHGIANLNNNLPVFSVPKYVLSFISLLPHLLNF